MSTPLQLPESVWNLHRNSLLASSAALFLCLPNVSPQKSQTFLWITLNQPAPTLRVIAMAVATYALLAFVVEWYEYGMALYRERKRGYTSAADELNTLGQRFSHEFTSLDSSVKAFAELVKSVSASQFILKDKQRVTQEAIDRVYGHLRNDIGFSEQNIVDPFRKNNLTAEATNVLLPMLQNALSDMKAKAANLVVPIAMEEIEKISTIASHRELKEIELRIPGLQNDIDVISRQIDENRQSLLALKHKLRLDRFASDVRIQFVLLGIPMILYVIAVAHYIGKLGYALFPSAILFLLT